MSAHWNATSELQPTPLPARVRVVLAPLARLLAPGLLVVLQRERAVVCALPPRSNPSAGAAATLQPPPGERFRSLLQAGCAPCAAVGETGESRA